MGAWVQAVQSAHIGWDLYLRERLAQTCPALLAIFLVMGGYLIFNLTDAGNKYMLAQYQLYHVVFFSSSFAALAFFLLGVHRGLKKSFRTRKAHLHALRTVLLCLCTVMVALSLHHLPLANFYALVFITPMVTTLLAALFLGDKITPARWATIFLAFAGVLIIANPSAEGLGIGVLYALIAVFTIASSSILIRKMDSSDSMVLYGFPSYALCAVGCLPFLIGDFIIPSLSDLLIFAAIGFGMFLAVSSVTQGYKITPQVSIVAPFQYVQMVGGVILGYMFWNDVPASHVWIGTAMIIASGLYIIYEQRGRRSPIAR